MKQQSFIVTENNLKSIKARYYGGGQEIKIGDKICYGYIMTYANLNGVPTTKFNPDKDWMSMVMVSFVLDKKTGMLFQLYSIEK